MQQDARYNPEGLINAAEQANAAGSPGGVIFLDNPANPLGTLLSPAEIESFLAKIPKGWLAVIDEAYWEYLQPEEQFKGGQYLREHPDAPVVFLHTLSKAYGFAGGRVGYAFSSSQIAEVLNKNNTDQLTVTTLSALSAQAIIEDQSFLRLTRRFNAIERGKITRALSKLGVEYIEPHANFVTFKIPDVSQAAAFKASLDSQGVMISWLKGYGLEDHFRVTVGDPAGRQAFLRALKIALKAIG